MYERFTDQARKAMHAAEKVARKRKHEYVGTEHVLLGILATEGVGYNMLVNWLKADLKQLTADVDAVLTDGTATVLPEGKLPLTTSAKQVMERAIAESRRLQIDYVGTEHLLIALTMTSTSIAGHTLLLQGVTPEKAREACAAVTGLNFGKPAGELPEKPKEKLWTIEIPQPAPSAVENVITMSLENTQQRDRSGSIDDPRPLVSFLYELMRDHLPTGVVEHITRNSTGVGGTKFCNGWLALYAQDVANRLLAGPPPVEPVPKADEPKPAPTTAADAPPPE